MSDHTAETRPGTSPAGFPVGRTLASLILVGAAGLAGLTGIAHGVWEDPAAWRAVLLVGGTSCFAALVSLAPVAGLARRGVMPTMVGYFAGAAGRVLICLAVVLLAVGLWEMPAAAAVLGLSLYLPLLLIEVAWIGRYLWSLDALQTAPGR
ncbi:MAG: hypothetical protein ACLFV3_11785 [Phycisphaeraceae bacterium]